MKIFFTLFVIVILQSCSTSPVSPQLAKTVKKENVYKYSEKSSDKDGRITVVRDSGFTGGLCAFGLYINNEVVADLETSEKVDIYLPAGEYKIGLGSSKKGVGICSSLDIYNSETTIKDNQEKIFRIWITGNGSFGISAM